MAGFHFLCFLIVLCCTQIVYVEAQKKSSCRFALDYECADFFLHQDHNIQLSGNEKDQYAVNQKTIDDYLSHVMKWEGQFAQPGIGYDAKSGYTYDGHPLNYTTGALYGDPHLFSAPSKESIHMSMLALALSGNKHALEFSGGFEKTMDLLHLKIKGYMQFNESYPGFGCFTPWVGFNSEKGTFEPIDSWTKPYYKVPSLDNGEWFWALYAIAHLLSTQYMDTYPILAKNYNGFVTCQKDSAKTIFYRGKGMVSATVYILDPKKSPTPDNYIHCDGYLDDPYEGETMTQLMYLFSAWDSDEERDLLWQTKRAMFQAINYTVPESFLSAEEIAAKKNVITVQKGFWFSTHEQWKTLLLPYLAKELPLVQKLFRNAEKARTYDAYISKLPGLQASINDVTDGSEEIPCYASACGIQSLAFQNIERRDLMTPYGSFGLFLHSPAVGFCWYNNMLSAPRMQSSYGSTEAINANSTEISPLTTWDSKITTVLAMLQGIGSINEKALRREKDAQYGTAYDRFVYIVNREHELLFGTEQDVLGDNIRFQIPNTHFNGNTLSDWDLTCA